MHNHLINQSEVIRSFTSAVSSDATETIKDLYRGFIQSEFADGLSGTQRSNIYFTVERLVDLVEGLTQDNSAQLVHEKS